MGKTWMEAIVEREAQLGTDTVARMAKIFVGDSKAQVNTIGAALARNELATARSAARDLTNNAGSLGFIRLEEAARDCERDCAKGDIEKAVATHKSLLALVEICVFLLRGRYKLS
ncbi:MAG: hypothetical protein GC190_00325 [Alphaproteobacteria bacterium]|nr:hypothetical protein [Alphaproteobacteria bacterium]